MTRNVNDERTVQVSADVTGRGEVRIDGVEVPHVTRVLLDVRAGEPTRARLTVVGNLVAVVKTTDAWTEIISDETERKIGPPWQAERDNTAYRHRYGRVQDMPPAPRPLIRVWEAWVALGVLLAWLAFIAWAIWRAGE